MSTLCCDIEAIETIENGLVGNKVAKFSYTECAYNSNDVNGVCEYDVACEQNIPIADPSVLKVNETVINKGYRSQASSITRMLVNHFFGRVSYNLNKLNDNFSCFMSTIKGYLGLANGIATLDECGRIPYSQLPETAQELKGTWNASTNVWTGNAGTTGSLIDGTGTLGDTYIVSVEGWFDSATGTGSPTEVSGYVHYFVNDRIMYNGSDWVRLTSGGGFVCCEQTYVLAGKGATVGTYGISLGCGANASEGVAIGCGASTNNCQGVAIGSGAKTGGHNGNVAIGLNAHACSSNNIAIGGGAMACLQGNFNIAIGQDVLCCNDCCHNIAIGARVLCMACGGSNIAIGNRILECSLYCSEANILIGHDIGCGNNTLSQIDNSVMLIPEGISSNPGYCFNFHRGVFIGSPYTTAPINNWDMTDFVAIGYCNSVEKSCAVGIGSCVTACDNSTAVGYKAYGGSCSVAVGACATASAKGIAIGASAKACGVQRSIAIGLLAETKCCNICNSSNICYDWAILETYGDSMSKIVAGSCIRMCDFRNAFCSLAPYYSREHSLTECCLAEELHNVSGTIFIGNCLCPFTAMFQTSCGLYIAYKTWDSDECTYTTHTLGIPNSSARLGYTINGLILRR